MSQFWQKKIKAFLHDPPDKALILGHIAHEKRREDILQTLGLTYDESLDNADQIASAMQRIDIPEELRGFSVYFKNPVKPVFKHTLSGETENLDEVKDFIAKYGYKKALDSYCFDLETARKFLKKKGNDIDWRHTYLLLWRYLPEGYPLGYFLPAETRMPDHSIWDHLDVTAAISPALGDMGLFAVKISAVQEFISHSRKLSDLWASSHIFSTIIFEGIKAIIEEYGPDAVIYPQLRGNPMVDTALFETLDKNRLPIANLPNTFLAFIPASKGNEICLKVEEEIRGKWKEIAEKTYEILKRQSITIDKGLWDHQIDDAIDVVSTSFEFFNFDKFKGIKDEIPGDLKEGQEKWLDFVVDSKSYHRLRVERHGLSQYKIFEGGIEKLDINVTGNKFVEKVHGIFEEEKLKILESLYEWLQKDPSHFYYITYELLGIILAQKSRLWEAWEEKPITKKCLMCGRRNAVIKKDRDGKYQYWAENGWKTAQRVEEEFKFTLKERERLCAVCLAKRVYPRVFEDVFKTNPPEFESVVNIAARDFLKNAEADEEIKRVIKEDAEFAYKHEWELQENEKIRQAYHKAKEGLENLWEAYGEPNKYYAILMMDGDEIGKTLSGEKLPDFGEFFHPAFKNKVKGDWDKGEELINTRRILTASHHIAISRAMKDFSLYKVPEIANKYDGFLVYSGGDDVLALFPTDKVLPAAKEIQDLFKEDFYEIDGKKVMGLGKYASMSAGIVFAHYKYPLYDVIEKVRGAEKKAKSDYKRDAFCMSFVKRSGEVLECGGKWDFIDDLVSIANAIQNEKISHRFIYDFMEIIKILNQEDMLKSEIRRLIERRKTERATDEEIDKIFGKISCLIDKYKSNNLPIENVGNAFKILYDAYRGEER